MEQNVPCPVAKYFEEVVPIMPIHINDCRGFENKVVLAKRALRKNQAKIENDWIVDFKRLSRCRWHAMSDGLNEIDLSSLDLPPKEKGAFREWLRRNNYKLISTNKYQLQENE
jgi:hypothetical protein